MTPKQLAALAIKAAGVGPHSPNFKNLVEKVTDTINAERAAMSIEVTATKARWYDSADAIAALDHLFSSLKRSWVTPTVQKKD